MTNFYTGSPGVGSGKVDLQKNPVTLSLALQKKERKTNLANLVCDSVLPTCIRVTKKFSVPGCKSVYQKGDILLLHFIYERPVIYATDRKTGENLMLPLYADEQYEILPLEPSLDDREYDGTAELMDSKPLPQEVRVFEAHRSTDPEEMQEEGDIIEIQGLENHRRKGKVLVGMVAGSKVRLSRSMIFSRYTTMISPSFHKLSQLKTRKFPQRVRIPDFTEGKRNKRIERILTLTKYHDEKCILATRDGDANVYSLPLTCQVALEKLSTDTGRHVLSGLPPIYPLLNTTWGVVDPTLGWMPSSMEGIPQPLEPVLQAWLASWEGKKRADTASSHHNTDMELKVKSLVGEIDRLKYDLESYKLLVNKSKMDDFSLPSSSAKSEQTNVEKKNAANGQEKESGKESTEDEDTSAEYTYAVEGGAASDSGSDGYEECCIGDSNQTTKKNKKNTATAKEYEKLLIKYEETLKENTTLKKENTDLKEEIDTLHEQMDYEENYSFCNRENKPNSHNNQKRGSNTSDHSATSSRGKDNDQTYVITLPSGGPRGKGGEKENNSPHTDQPEPSFEIDTTDGDTEEDYLNVRPSPSAFKPRIPPKSSTLPKDFSLLRVPTLPKRKSAASDDDSEEMVAATTATVDPINASPLRDTIKEAVVVNYQHPSKDCSPNVAEGTTMPPVPAATSKIPEVGVYSHPRPGPPRRMKPPPPPRDVSLPGPAKETRKDTGDVARSPTSPIPQPPIPIQLPNINFRQYSTSDVGLFLKKRNLTQYTETFLTENIDGDLLLTLDREILIGDLGMSERDAQKLIIALCDVRSSTA